jgi:O-antigen ligase
LLARLPHMWMLCACAVGLQFAAHLLYGANSNISALSFAMLWSMLGAGAILAPDTRNAVRLNAPLAAAAICFVGVLAVGAFQLLPGVFGVSHPLWINVDGASALTVDRDATARELVKVASLAGAFCTGLVIGVSDKRARFFVYCTLVAAGFYGAWAFLQQVLEPGTILGAPKPYHFNRLSGSFLSANSAATVFGIFALVATARLTRAVKESGLGAGRGASTFDALARKGGLSAVVVALSLACLLLTGSRAGAAATLGALLAFLAWEAHALGVRARARGLTPLMVIGALILVGAAALSGGDTFARLDTTAADAGARLTVFTTHWRAILASPWLGHGLGGFPAVNDFMLDAQNHLSLERLNALHNVYLQWLEEAGVFGAGLMFACIGFLLAAIWRGFSERHAMRTWMRAVFAISLLVCVHGLVDYALQVPSIAWLWATWLGVGCGVAAPTRRRGVE